MNAEIEIVALRPGEEDTLVARIAPLDAFTAAGIEPSAMLQHSCLRGRSPRQPAHPAVTTTAPVNDPFVEILIELQWGSGRLVREYTFLLDPPEYKARDTSRRAEAGAAKPAARSPAAPPEAVKPPPPVEAKPIEPAAPAAPVIAPAPTAPRRSRPKPRPPRQR